MLKPFDRSMKTIDEAIRTIDEGEWIMLVEIHVTAPQIGKAIDKVKKAYPGAKIKEYNQLSGKK